MVVLDTDHVSVLEWPGPEADRLRERLKTLPGEEATTTIISFEEQMRGWMTVLAKARSVLQEVSAYQRLWRQLQHYSEIRVLPFDELAATQFQRLRKLKLRVGTMDLKIAAIVLANDATLLSRNLGDFKRVPGLKVEDWTK